MIMDQINDNSKIEINHKFRDRCLTVLCILWPILILSINFEVGSGFQNIRNEADKFIYWAGGLLAIQQFFIQHHKNRELLHKLAYLVQILIVVIGITSYIPALKHQFFGKNERELTMDIIQKVTDSTDYFKTTLNMENIYTDCQGTGAIIKNYRTAFLTRLLKKEKIPPKDTLKYISKVDSAVIDPISDACNRANQFAQMLVEFSMLIRMKNIDGINNFFHTYHISPSAKAIEFRAGHELRRGLLRTFIIDVMQDLTPTFKDIKPPAYLKRDAPIQQLIFTTI
jgi:hypothetical protein